MTKERRWDNSNWPNWLNKAWQKDSKEVNSLFCICGREKLFIHTLEGNYKVTFDDYIIKGIKNEIYPCKPDIFKETYEEA